MRFVSSDEFRGKSPLAGSQELEPMFCAKQPSHILVSAFARPTKPTDIKPETTADFCKKEKIAWCESPVVAASLRDQSFVRQRYNSVSQEEIKAVFVDSHVAEVLQNPRDDLVICKMDDRVGKGLLLSPYSKKPIKAGDIIGLYPGVCTSNTVLSNFFGGQSDFSSFGFEVDPGSALCHIKSAYNDAIYWRNHLAYVQHALSAEKLKSLKIDAGIKRKIVTSNVICVSSVYMGFPVLQLVAICDIDPGKHIYFDYGESFWSNPKSSASGKGGYFLFDDNARIIGRVDSTNKFKAAKTVNMKAADVKRPHLTEEEAFKFFRENSKRPVEKYQEIFVANVRQSIEHNLKRKARNEVLTCLNKILSLDYTGVERFYREVANIINSDEFKSFRIEYLAEEIILCMHAYNTQRALSGLKVLEFQEQQGAPIGAQQEDHFLSSAAKRESQNPSDIAEQGSTIEPDAEVLQEVDRILLGHSFGK